MNSDINIKKISTINTHVDILCVKYINQRKQIAGGLIDGSVHIFNAKTLKQEFSLVDSETANINNAVTSIVPEPRTNNLITCTYSGGLLKIWDYSNNVCVCTIREKRQLYGVVYHPKRPKFFTFGDDGSIALYDSETKQKEYIYQKSERNFPDGHVSKVFSLRFNPAYPNEFSTGGWDSTLYIWDVRVQNAIRYISDVFLGGDGIIMTKTGNEIITCEWKRDDPLKMWDYKTGKLLKVITPDMDDCQLYCGTLVDANNIAIGGSNTNLYRLVNIRSNVTISYIKGLPQGVYSIDATELNKKDKFQSKYDEFADVPTILFVSGKNIYEVRYR